MLKKILNDYSEYLQAEKLKAATTRRNYIRTVRQFLKVCGEHPKGLYLPVNWKWDDIDKRAVEIYLNHLRVERGWSPATMTQQASALRAFFGFLEAKGHIRRNPARSLKPKAPPLGPPPEGDEETVRALFETPARNLDEARLVLLMELFYGAAMRSGQVYAIQWMRTNKRKSVCTFAVIQEEEAPEGGPLLIEHQVVLSADGLERARHYLDLRGSLPKPRRAQGKRAPFWVNSQGLALPNAVMSREVKAALEQVGLDGGPSLLRQLAARHFRERGADSRSVRNLLGAKRLGRLDRFGPPETRKLLEQFRSAHPRHGGQNT